MLARKRNRERKAAESEGAVEQASGRETGGTASQITPEERRLIGRLGGRVARAKHDPRATTEAARAAAEAAYERQVDPDAVLLPAERARRARAARAAFFTSLALRSLNARAKRKVHGRDQAGDDQRVIQLAATQRRLRARLGAYTRLAHNDPAAITAHARETTEMRWRRQVDPLGTLTQDELEMKVREAKSEHFQRLARLSAQKRAGKA